MVGEYYNSKGIKLTHWRRRVGMQLIPKWNMSLTDTLLVEIAKLDSKLRHAIQKYAVNIRGNHF